MVVPDHPIPGSPITQRSFQLQILDILIHSVHLLQVFKSANFGTSEASGQHTDTISQGKHPGFQSTGLTAPGQSKVKDGERMVKATKYL